MKIFVHVIPHNKQNYDTVGDWKIDDDGFTIKVSDMENWKYELLVAVHELVEVALCADRGIKDEGVIAFDKRFEEMRSAFPDLVRDDEPGFHPNAPYRAEHTVATQIERMLAKELKVDWKDYDDAVNNLKYE